MRLSILKNFRQFFVENRLTFSRLEDILMLRSGDSYIAGSAVELLSSVISAKGNENLPSLKKLFCSQKRNNPARDLSVFVSCWAFLCRFESRFWQDLRYRVRGTVRLFLCLAAASCAGMTLTLPRSPCFCSIVPTVIKFIQSEIRSSGGLCYIPSAYSRKLPNAFLPRFSFLFSPYSNTAHQKL